MVEIYDLALTSDSQLSNISTRGFVDTGDNVLIGGFIIGPSDRANGSVLVRAIGPSLTANGSPMPGRLLDPKLDLFNSNGAMIGSNDDWMSMQQTEIEATGHPPTDKKESALIAPLVPGAYTAIVRGVGESTGVALVEVYQLP
ncbi:MAG: hypothetical protein M3Y86_09000 [Verrucomicrobiota bacterium]|nr:hypothetical protein [Verrucomicrobiota bacterium]